MTATAKERLCSSLGHGRIYASSNDCFSLPMPYRGFWRTDKPADTTCPRCGSPAASQLPTRVWTRDAGNIERHCVTCLPRTTYIDAYGRTMPSKGCGTVLIAEISLDDVLPVRPAPPPEVATDPSEDPPAALPPEETTPEVDTPMPVKAVPKKPRTHPASGLHPHIKSFPVELVAECVAEIRAGRHPHDVADDRGLKRNTVSRWARDAGIDYERRRGSNPWRRQLTKLLEKQSEPVHVVEGELPAEVEEPEVPVPAPFVPAPAAPEGLVLRILTSPVLRKALWISPEDLTDLHRFLELGTADQEAIRRVARLA